MVARSAQHFRIAPEEESDRTAVRALGAGVQNSAVFCARSVRTAVRSRRRCPADTFGATFWCQKVVNPLLAGDAESKVRNFPKESKNRFHFFSVLLASSKSTKRSSTPKSSGRRHPRSLSDHARSTPFAHDRSGRSHRCRHSFRSFRSAFPQAETR